MVSSSGNMKNVSKVVEKVCLDTGDTISLRFFSLTDKVMDNLISFLK